MFHFLRAKKEDDGYHVNGALVLAPERTVSCAHGSAAADHQGIPGNPIPSSSPRGDQEYHRTLLWCCSDPDFLRRYCIVLLTKLKYTLQKKLALAVVLDGIELICGRGSSLGCLWNFVYFIFFRILYDSGNNFAKLNRISYANIYKIPRHLAKFRDFC